MIKLIKTVVVACLFSASALLSTSPEQKSFLDMLYELFASKPEQKPQAHEGVNADGTRPSFSSGLENHGEWRNTYFSSSDMTNFPWRNLLKKSADRVWYAWDYTNGATGYAEATPRVFLLLTKNATDPRVMNIDIQIDQLSDRNVDSCQELLKRLTYYIRKNGQFASIEFEIKNETHKDANIFILRQAGFKPTADGKYLVRNV